MVSVTDVIIFSSSQPLNSTTNGSNLQENSMPLADSLKDALNQPPPIATFDEWTKEKLKIEGLKKIQRVSRADFLLKIN